MSSIGQPINLAVAVLIACVVFSANGIAFAQEQREPERRSPRPDNPITPGGGGGGGGFGRGWWGPQGPPNEEEWEKIGKFMEQYSPLRWKAYQGLLNSVNANPGGFPTLRGIGVRRLFTQRYRMITHIEKTEPQAYQTRLKRLMLEDEIFGLSRQLRDVVDTARESEIRQQLRAKIGEWFDVGLTERQQRIEHWTKQLEQERQALADERAKRDELIRRRLRAAEQEAGAMEQDERAASQPATQPAPKQ